MIWGKPPRGQCEGGAWSPAADERNKTMKARWLARSAFALMLAAVAVLIGFAELGGLAMIVIGVIGAILVLFALHRLIWVALASVALIVLAGAVGRKALAPAAVGAAMPSLEVLPPKRAFLIMNPRSGGGKVTRFGLKEKAEALGAEVALLEGPGVVDVADLARKAVAAGAELLGVAGGDGTQALVAGIAAEHGLPFLVISAGTRNHFAMDLGLDRENP